MTDTILTTVSIGSGTITNSGLTYTDTTGDGSFSVCLTNNQATGKQTFEASIIGSFLYNHYTGVGIGTTDFNPNNGVGTGIIISYFSGFGWACYYQDNGTSNYQPSGGLTPNPSNDSTVYTITLDYDTTSGKVYVRLNGDNLFDGTSPATLPTTNNYPLIAAGSGSYGSVKFKSLTYPPQTGYSEFDTTAPVTPVTAVYAYLARNNAKRYFEVTINDNLNASNTCVGIADAANTDNFFVLNQNGNVYPTGSGPSFTTSNTITIAVDFTSNKIYFGKDATPNTAATGISITANKSYVPVIITDSSGVDVTLNEGD